MNPEIKARWVAALRSGEYRQGQGLLRDSLERFCCLGVLCEIAVQDGVIAPPKLDLSRDAYVYDRRSDLLYSGPARHGDVAYPPEAVRAWAGLEHPNVAVVHHGNPTSLATLNDSGKPFNVIAQIIEEQL